MTDEHCELCSSPGPLHLHAKCHGNAPLRATLEGGEIVLRCYVPSCMREVARYRIYQGFPEKFAIQNVIGNQAAEIARLQAELAEVKAGYHRLDANWSANHRACLDAIYAAVGKDSVPDAVEEIGRLKGELAAVREDAERYRAVRDIDPHSNEAFIVDYRIAEDGRLPRQEYLDGIKLDRAIDAYLVAHKGRRQNVPGAL